MLTWLERTRKKGTVASIFFLVSAVPSVSEKNRQACSLLRAAGIGAELRGSPVGNRTVCLLSSTLSAVWSVLGRTSICVVPVRSLKRCHNPRSVLCLVASSSARKACKKDEFKFDSRSMRTVQLNKPAHARRQSADVGSRIETIYDRLLLFKDLFYTVLSGISLLMDRTVHWHPCSNCKLSKSRLVAFFCWWNFHDVTIRLNLVKVHLTSSFFSFLTFLLSLPHLFLSVQWGA